MFDADISIWAVAVIAVIIAGISKGGFGAGLGFLATPLLALAVTPAEAAAIMLPVLILIDQVGMITYWRKWTWAIVWPVLVAAAVGIGAGTFAFGSFSTDLLRLGLGVISLLFLVFQLAKARGWNPPSYGGRGFRAAIWGAATGFTSTVAHAGGPPVTIYLLGERLEKTHYQACSVLIFWAVNLMKLGPYAAIGALDASSLKVSAALAPVAIIGVLLGVWAHKRASQELFFRAMAILLGLTGVKLVWDGLSGLL